MPAIRGNSLYTIVDGPSWAEAESNASKLGGHLFTASNNQEAQYITDYFGNIPIEKDRVWIGRIKDEIIDEFIQTDWHWSSGEASDYTATIARTWSDGPRLLYAPIVEQFQTQLLLHDHTYSDEDTKPFTNKAGAWIEYGYPDPYPSIYDGDLAGLAEIPFIRRGDSAYVIVEGPTWEEAEANAIALGGHLVTINDAEENQWLVDRFKDKDITYNPEDTHPVHLNTLWTGLTRHHSEAPWEWSSGEDVEYLNFGPKEPFNGLSHAAINTQKDGDFKDKDPNWWGNHHGSWADYGRETDMLYGIAEIPLESNIAPKGFPILSGDFKAGHTISIDISEIEDPDNFDGWTPKYHHHWEIADDPGMLKMMPLWKPLKTDDATDGDKKLEITKDLSGKLIRSVSSYIDGYGTKEVIRSEDVLIKDQHKTVTPFTLELKGRAVINQSIAIDLSSIPEGYRVMRYGHELAPKQGENIYPIDFSSFSYEINTYEYTLDKLYDGRVFETNTFENAEELEHAFRHIDLFELEINGDHWLLDAGNHQYLDFYSDDRAELLRGAMGSGSPHGFITLATEDGQAMEREDVLNQLENKPYSIDLDTGYGLNNISLRPGWEPIDLDVKMISPIELELSSSSEGHQFTTVHESLLPSSWSFWSGMEGDVYRAFTKLINMNGEISYAYSEPLTIGSFKPYLKEGEEKADSPSSFTSNNTTEGNLLINGVTKHGKKISLDISTLSDKDGFNHELGFSYWWQIHDTNTGNWLKLETSDATDGNDSLTLTEALVGKKLRGQASYSDGNGLTEVVATDSFTVTAAPPTGPYQEISTASDTIYFAPGGTLSVPLSYSHTPEQPNSGITIDVHYNSSRFTPIGENNGVSNMLGYTPTNQLINTAIISDDDDRDKDPTTDRAIRLSWIDPSQTFPDTDLPAELGTLNFQNLDSSESTDPITGSRLHITPWDQPPGYEFMSSPIELLPQEFNLDVDGDGRVSLYTDGIMVIRRLIGLDTCTDGFSFDQGSMHSAEETDALLDHAYEQGHLNFDQVGDRPSLYTDGILMIRYLITPQLVSESNHLIGAGSPYKNNPESIIDMFDSLMPADI